MAPDSSSARVPAPWPLPETSTTATSSRSPLREVTTKSPAKGVPPAERSSAAAYHSSGSAGMPPWRRIRSRRSTNICSPWSPATPRRERRKRREQDEEAEAEDDHDRRPPTRTVIVLLCGTTQRQDEQHEDDEPRQLARAEHEAGHHERHEQRRRAARSPGTARSATPMATVATTSATRIREPRGRTRLSAASNRWPARGARGASRAHVCAPPVRRRLGRRLYGAGAEGGLTSRTPEDVASDELPRCGRSSRRRGTASTVRR